jgi:hypothetical protein
MLTDTRSTLLQINFSASTNQHAGAEGASAGSSFVVVVVVVPVAIVVVVIAILAVGARFQPNVTIVGDPKGLQCS